jgi:hypothetical protein
MSADKRRLFASLDGVKHRQIPAAWDTYKAGYRQTAMPGQVQVLNLEDYLCWAQSSTKDQRVSCEAITKSILGRVRLGGNAGL